MITIRQTMFSDFLKKLQIANKNIAGLFHMYGN